MSEQTGQIFLAPRRRLSVPSLWSVGAMLIATLVVLPILAVIWFALTPTDNIWPHLWATTLPRYLANTGLLDGVEVVQLYAVWDQVPEPRVCVCTRMRALVCICIAQSG